MFQRQLLAPVAVACALCGSSSLGAVMFSFTSGGLGASAIFEVSGTNLVVTLTNTGTADCLVPTDVLTAVFFKVSGSALTLTRVSADLAPGSSVVGKGTLPSPTTNPTPNGVGGEWAYKSAVAGPHGTGYGISSAGFGLFGPGDRFPGSDLQPPPSPDGLQYGIVSAGDDPSTGNGDFNNTALIKNSVIFTLSGLPDAFDLSRITDVWFQYGTSLDDPSYAPAPGSLSLMAAGILIAYRRRRAA